MMIIHQDFTSLYLPVLIRDQELIERISKERSKEYYNILGWDERGIPLKKTLKELGLEKYSWIIDELSKKD